jgi:hypothetical protein
MAVTKYGNKVLEVLASKEEALRALHEYKDFYINNMTRLYIKKVASRV